MGWDEAQLPRFRLRGKDYGISRIGGLSFRDDPPQVRLTAIGVRPNDRFLYEYDFGDLWQHVGRVERHLPLDTKRTYPVCLGGKRAVPPEDGGGPWGFMALQEPRPGTSWASWRHGTPGWSMLTVGRGTSVCGNMPRRMRRGEGARGGGRGRSASKWSLRRILAKPHAGTRGPRACGGHCGLRRWG
jgi:hypothetical protein